MISTYDLGCTDNTDNTARLKAAIELGLSEISIEGNLGVTSLVATLSGPLKLSGTGRLYRIGAGNTDLVNINTNGHDFAVTGNIVIDGLDNCATGLIATNTTATQSRLVFEGLTVKNIYRRFNAVKGNAWGLVGLGNFNKPTAARCNIVNVRREADSSVPGSSGSAAIVFSGIGAFYPSNPHFVDCEFDTVACDDLDGSSKNADCDGVVAFTGAFNHIGLAVGKQHEVVIINLRGRNTKGRAIKTQSGTLSLNGFSYIHENMGSIELGLNLINPQAGVVVNIGGPIHIKFKNEGATPFRGAYAGTIVGLYTAQDNARPQVAGSIGPMTILSDYIGSGLQSIVSCMNGVANNETSILTVDGITGIVETRYFMTLPASSTVPQYIRIQNSLVSKIVSSLFAANADPLHVFITLKDVGHLDAQVSCIVDPSTLVPRVGNIEAIGSTLGIKGRTVDKMVNASGGLAVARQAFVAPLNGGSDAMGTDLEHAVFTANQETTLRPMSRRRGAQFTVIVTASTAGWNATFNVDGTAISGATGLNIGFFAFGNGADPGLPNVFNLWIDGATGSLKCFNRTGANRVALVRTIG